MRLCPQCLEEGRRSYMRPGTRHLHELSEGARFTFECRPEDPHLLEKVGPARCEVSCSAPPDRTHFRTADGREVAFTRKRSGRRSCTPFAQVRPLV